jgi:two-component system response regulator YesN
MKRVLIVEDNDILRGLLTAYIEHFNKNIVIDSVESAEEAIELMEIDKYLLIITDIALIKMNGLELCLKIREIDKNVKIIGISGYSKLLNENDLTLAGFNSYYTKPCGYKEFFSDIENIVAHIDK